MQWNFDSDLDGWAQSAPPMEMGLDVDAISGFLRGVLLPNAQIEHAFVDSPPLRVALDAADRDFVVLRMQHMGPCTKAMIAVEREQDEEQEDRGWKREHRSLNAPVEMPFELIATSDPALYFIPVGRHVSGIVDRLRLYPCIATTAAAATATSAHSGHAFRLDWVVFAKGMN